MRIEGTVEDIKKFFKGADIYDGVCNDNCDTCKRFDDCPVPAEAEKIKPEMFNLAELSMPWEEDFEHWKVDTLTLTKLEEAIIENLTSNVLPRHMKIHDWNLPYAEACILVIRREIAKLNGATCEKDTNFAILDRESKHFSSMDLRNICKPDARGPHRNGQPRSEPAAYICRVCGFTEVDGIFNTENWASKYTCACCADNNCNPEASLSLRPWLKVINTNAGKEDNAAKAAMDEHVHTHNESKEERTCKICGVTDDKIDPVGFAWAAPDLCQCCADKLKPSIPEEPHIRLSLNDILIPAFDHDSKLKSSFRTIFFTERADGKTVISYCGTKLYVSREKVLELPQPILHGYFGKVKSGTQSNYATAIRFYREYLALGVKKYDMETTALSLMNEDGGKVDSVQKENLSSPSPSPAVQLGSDQISQIKPFVDMRKTKEKHVPIEKPLKSDLLIPKFEWDEQAVVYYRHLQLCESDGGKVMLAYASARICTTKEKIMSIPYPTPGGYESLKVFATSARTAFRMAREYYDTQEQNQKIGKREQITNIHEQNPIIEGKIVSEDETDHKYCDNCGIDLRDMKGRSLCDDCQHIAIEAEADRLKKLEEKAKINERRWKKKALDEKKSEDPGEKGKMSEKTQALHDLVTGYKVGPGTKFGE